MLIDVVQFEEKLPFHSWRRNVYSQCGEDGIIENLLRLLEKKSGYFVEFGAWDGHHLSNCAKLAEGGWPGCFIEGDRDKYLDLKRRYETRTDISTVNAFVEVQGENSLDQIFKRQNAPSDITVLSIDIDGMDYHIWNSLRHFEPKICVVEFNPTVPARVSFVQDADPSVQQGSSLRALYSLAKKKGYALAAATDWNAIFVLEKLCFERSIPTYTPEQVKITQYETYLFHGYDGTLLTAGNRALLWHGVPFTATELQILPETLRHLPTGRSDSYLSALGKFRNKRSNS